MITLVKMCITISFFLPTFDFSKIRMLMTAILTTYQVVFSIIWQFEQSKSPEAPFSEKPESSEFLFPVYNGVAVFLVIMSIC